MKTAAKWKQVLMVVGMLVGGGLPGYSSDWVRVAYDDAGVPEAQPHLKKATANWKVPNTEAFDDALRTVVFGPYIDR